MKLAPAGELTFLHRNSGSERKSRRSVRHGTAGRKVQNEAGSEISHWISSAYIGNYMYMYSDSFANVKKLSGTIFGAVTDVIIQTYGQQVVINQLEIKHIN